MTETLGEIKMMNSLDIFILTFNKISQGAMNI